MKKERTDYSPVSNYMEQYGYAVRYDPETKQYVYGSTPDRQDAQPSAGYAAPQQYAPAASSGIETRTDPLSGTVITGSERKPFRRLANRASGAMLLYLVIDVIIGYLLIFVPVFANLGGALANTDALSLWNAHDFPGAYNAVIDYVKTVVSEDTFYTWRLIGTIVGALFASVVPMLIISKQYGFKAFDVLKKGKKYGAWQTVKALCTAFAAAYICSVIYILIAEVFPAVGQSRLDMDFPNHPLNAALLVFYTVICAPFLEEFIFRGVLLKALTPYGTFFASMVTALLFGLLHGNLQQTPYAFCIGLVFAYVAIKTGSIRTGILMHFIINLSSTALQLVQTFCSETLFNLCAVCISLFYIVSIVVAVVSLIVDRNKITFIQLPEEGNHIVLPVKAEQPEKKWLNTFTVVCMILFLIFSAYTIISPIIFGAAE